MQLQHSKHIQYSYSHIIHKRLLNQFLNKTFVILNNLRIFCLFVSGFNCNWIKNNWNFYGCYTIHFIFLHAEMYIVEHYNAKMVIVNLALKVWINSVPVQLYQLKVSNTNASKLIAMWSVFVFFFLLLCSCGVYMMHI